MDDNINHPPHYTKYPAGLDAECIEYTRHMPFSQGNAFKYLYRAGSKGDPTEDLAKCAWYVRDAIEHANYIRADLLRGFPCINSNSTNRSKTLRLIAAGRMRDVELALTYFGVRILETRESAAYEPEGQP